MKKFVSLHLLLFFLASGCQIRLLPEISPANKFTTSFTPPVFDRVCELPPVAVYFSGAMVSDPFRGKRVVVENESGEVFLVKGVEWGARFEDLLGRTFEDGLRTALSGFPSMIVLSPESGAESNFDIGINLTRHLLIEFKTDHGIVKAIRSSAILRIFEGRVSSEQYYVLSGESTLKDLSGNSYIEAIRENIRAISIEGYGKLVNYMCAQSEELYDGQLNN
jgi:ABC-type uncharacterized transport system auxiliary subunit